MMNSCCNSTDLFFLSNDGQMEEAAYTKMGIFLFTVLFMLI